MAKTGVKSSKGHIKRLYYLNDYWDAIPRVRIETRRGGDRCLWRERTTLKAMQTTKRFLEKTWQIKDN